MPARTVFSYEDLPANVSKIFDQAQSTTANHQKNLVALHKLQIEAAKHTESVQNGKSIKLTGERMFEDVVITMLSRVVTVKKGATVADRIVKFIGAYIKFLSEKSAFCRFMRPLFSCLHLNIAAEELNAKRAKGEEEEGETTGSRFTTRVLRFFLKGGMAKDKTVRYRVLQCIAEMISHLGEIEYVYPRCLPLSAHRPSARTCLNFFVRVSWSVFGTRRPPSGFRLHTLFARSALRMTRQSRLL